MEEIKQTTNYLYSRKNMKPIQVGDLIFDSSKPIIIAGPCTISSRDNLLELAVELKEIGIDILRGGAYKPRTSPYSFQGLGDTGLNYLIEAKKVTGLPIISEIMSVDQIEKYVENVDVIQVGSRNMYNYELLKALGKTRKPILLKRGFSSTYEEWLLSAEYIIKNGNDNIILCERGIRTFETETRNTLDLQAVPVIKSKSYLPIIVDPSHASGQAYIVEPMCLAAIASGADGIMIEVEKNISNAVCDKEQTINLETLKRIISKIK